MTADELLAAAEESIELWAAGGLDCEELAGDIAAALLVAISLGMAWPSNHGAVPPRQAVPPTTH